MGITDEYGFIASDGKNINIKLEGSTIICSEHIFGDLVFLKLMKGYDDKADLLAKTIGESSANAFSRKITVILPSYVEIVKPIPSLMTENVKPCSQCGGTMRSLGSDQLTCLNCGNTEMRKLSHLVNLAQNASTGGD